MMEFGVREAGARYTQRPAAYAVVFDEQCRIACVAETEGLFLPGGGLEAGEDASQAIVREVAEECAREFEIVERLGSAIQFFVAPDAERYELRASFFLGRFGSAIDREPELEMAWLPAAPTSPPFFHACHRWIVGRALRSIGA